METTRMIVQSHPECAELFQSMMQKDQQLWRKFGGPMDVLKWLHNFSGDREIYLALTLANGIIYYPLEQMRFLWNLILTNRVKLRLLEEVFGDGPLPPIDAWFSKYLRDKCVFAGYGPAGKSGHSQVYWFKQAHGFAGLRYFEFNQLLHEHETLKGLERVFLLDDIVASGEQATAMWYRRFQGTSLNDISEANPELRFMYLALVGYDEGRRLVEKDTPMTVILGDPLDECFRCFSELSTVYPDVAERDEARKVMEEKGRMLYPEHPLGYANMQLAIAFHHNTPDNTLPVIWKRLLDGGWYPLFERFE